MPKLPRRALVGLLATTLPVTTTLPGTAKAQMGGPSMPIRRLNEALLQAMHAGTAMPFAERARLIAPAVEHAFDLAQILRSSVGPRWSAMPAPQQADLLDVFTHYTVASYVANFDNFAGERFDILPDLRQVGSDQVVQTRIVPATGDATRIDYQMRDTGAGWRVVDVLLEGSISRVAVQRSDFRSLLATGDPGPLIASLRSKIAGLESGGKP
jgi:phospholipid transport system substrate-binding protein